MSYQKGDYVVVKKFGVCQILEVSQAGNELRLKQGVNRGWFKASNVLRRATLEEAVIYNVRAIGMYVDTVESTKLDTKLEEIMAGRIAHHGEAIAQITAVMSERIRNQTFSGPSGKFT
jgi:hypothetical protein